MATLKSAMSARAPDLRDSLRSTDFQHFDPKCAFPDTTRERSIRAADRAIQTCRLLRMGLVNGTKVQSIANAGPSYLPRGRINWPDRVCSIACAHQPTLRPIRKRLKGAF